MEITSLMLQNGFNIKFAGRSVSLMCYAVLVHIAEYPHISFQCLVSKLVTGVLKVTFTSISIPIAAYHSVILTFKLNPCG